MSQRAAGLLPAFTSALLPTTHLCRPAPGAQPRRSGPLRTARPRPARPAARDGAAGGPHRHPQHQLHGGGGRSAAARGARPAGGRGGQAAVAARAAGVLWAWRAGIAGGLLRAAKGCCGFGGSRAKRWMSVTWWDEARARGCVVVAGCCVVASAKFSAACASCPLRAPLDELVGARLTSSPVCPRSHPPHRTDVCKRRPVGRGGGAGG